MSRHRTRFDADAGTFVRVSPRNTRTKEKQWRLATVTRANERPSGRRHLHSELSARPPHSATRRRRSCLVWGPKPSFEQPSQRTALQRKLPSGRQARKTASQRSADIPLPGTRRSRPSVHDRPRTMSIRRPTMRSPSARRPLWAYSLVTQARSPRTPRAVSSANDRST